MSGPITYRCLTCGRILPASALLDGADAAEDGAVVRADCARDGGVDASVQREPLVATTLDVDTEYMVSETGDNK